MKTPVISRWWMGKRRAEGVARPVVREKGAIRGEEEERGSSEDGETLVLQARARAASTRRVGHFSLLAPKGQ
jgi:hypothetical protein